MSRFRHLTDEAKQHIREVSVLEAESEQAAGALLIDVRESEEFARGHAPRAIPLSRGVLELKIEELAPNSDTPILLYCGGGSRSALSAESLQRMGYTNVASVAGGFKAWVMRGLPVEA